MLSGRLLAYLLLAGSPDFFDVVEVLFGGRPIGERFEDALYAGVRVGREKGKPAMVLLNQHHSNEAAYRRVGGQERFVGYFFRRKSRFSGWKRANVWR